MKRMGMKLAKVLRYVPEGESVLIQMLAMKTSKTQSITIDLAMVYIYELIQGGYLAYGSTTTIVRGPVPYPLELVPGGYYTFESECWSCGKRYEKQLDIFTTRIGWDCVDCSVGWVENVVTE